VNEKRLIEQQAENEAERVRLQTLIGRMESSLSDQSRQLEQVQSMSLFCSLNFIPANRNAGSCNKTAYGLILSRQLLIKTGHPSWPEWSKKKLTYKQQRWSFWNTYISLRKCLEVIQLRCSCRTAWCCFKHSSAFCSWVIFNLWFFVGSISCWTTGDDV